MTQHTGPTPGDIQEWSLYFWAYLARFVDDVHHAAMVMEHRDRRVEIEPSGSTGGVVRIYRRDDGSLREESRLPFELGRPPFAVAQEVAARLRVPVRGELLDAMHRTDFIRTLQRAQTESPGSKDAVTLEVWAQRLLPYMLREPGLTVAEALKKFNAKADV